MNIGSYMVERLAEISTIALNIYFFYRTLETKRVVSAQILAGAIFVLIRMAYYGLGFSYRPYFSVVAGIVYAGFMFYGKFKTHVIWALIPVVLDGIVDAAIISLYLLFPNTSSTQVDSPGLTRIIIIIVSKATLFVTFYLITRKIDKSHIILWRDCILLLTFPIGCWIMLEFVFQYSSTPTTEGMSLPLLAAGSIVLFLMMASVIALYNRITVNGKELAQSKLQLRTAEMTQDHISQINDMYAQLSSIRHDLKNHFSAIAGYLKSKDYNALEQYICNLVGADMAMDTTEYVRHPVLNALICSRMATAKDANIGFIVDIVLPENLPVTDVDLCILVSNILDNAFEANERAFEPRFIKLWTRVVDSYWVIACRNSTCEQGKFRATGSLKSTKVAEGVHGIGTRQIRQIAEKTGGFVTYRHENYEFSTLVTIKLLP